MRFENAFRRRATAYLLAAATLIAGGASLAATDPPGWADPGSHWRGRWYVASPPVLGFDPARLSAAISKIGEMPGVYSFLLVRNGYLVEERYWREGTREKPHNLKSASKSVISALVGIAIAKGYFGLDQPIIELLPQARRFLNDPVKRHITVRHLLNMTSGLKPTSYQSYNSWVVSRDWIKEALEDPLLSVPGAAYHYSTANSHLLSAILAANTGMSTRAFAEKTLFGPMGIAIHGWETDPDGVHVGGNNLSLLPRDMAKFGQLHLDGGRWENRQLVPRWWIDASVGVTDNGPHEVYGNYGFLWWSRPLDEKSFAAVGYGGQYIVVSPRNDIVIVVTSTLESKGRPWESELFDLLRYGVLGSLTDPSMPPPVLAATITANVNLRSVPSTSGQRLALVSEGSRVVLSRRDGEWVFGSAQGQEGWLHADYIDQLALTSNPAPAASETQSAGQADALLQALAVKQKAESALTASRIQIEKLEHALEREQAANQRSASGLDKAREAFQNQSVRVAMLESKLTQAGARRREMERIFDADRAQLAQLEDALSQSKATAHDLSSKLHSRLELVKDLEQAFNREQSSRQSVQSELDSTRKQIARLNDELTQTLAAKQFANAALDESQDRVGLMENELAKTRAAQQANAAELESSKDEIARLESAVSNARSNSDTLSADLASERLRIARLERSLTESKTAHQSLSSELDASQEQVARLDADLAETNAAKHRLLTELQTSHEQFALLEKELTATRAAEQAASSEVKANREQIARLETDLAQLQSAKQALSSELEAGREQIALLKEDLVTTRAAEQAASSDVKANREQIARLETDLAQSQSAKQTLSSELEAGREQIVQLNDALEKIRQAGTTTRSELAELREVHQDQLFRNSKLENALTRIELDKASVLTKLETSRARIDVLQQTLAEARAGRDSIELALNELRQTLGKRDEHISNLESELTQSAAQRRTIEDAFEANRMKIATLEKALAQSDAARQTALAELAVARMEIAKLGDTLAETRSARDAATAGLTASGHRIDALENTLATAQAAEQLVTEKLAASRTRSGQLEAALSLSEGERQSIALQLESSRAEIKKLETAFADAEQASQTAVLKLSSSQKQVANLENALAQERAARQSVSSELDAGRENVSRLESALEQATLAGESARLELATLRAAMENQSTRLAEVKAELAREQKANALASSETRARESEIAKLQEALGRVKKVNEATAARLAESRTLVVDLENQRSQYQDQIARLEATDRERKIRSSGLVQLAKADTGSGTLTDQPVTAASTPTVLASAAPELPARDAPKVFSRGEIESFVLAWAAAWSQQNVADYLARYSPAFLPANGLSREKWERQRRHRLTRPAFIDIKIADISIEKLDAERARATFRQAYRADNFRDEVIKTLELIRRDKGWRILREVAR